MNTQEQIAALSPMQIDETYRENIRTEIENDLFGSVDWITEKQSADVAAAIVAGYIRHLTITY